MAYYPVMLNISGDKCLVVGGGKVSYRKILSLLECGALVSVIAPTICDEILELSKADKVSVIKREYIDNDVEGYKLVIVATNNENLNKKIALDSKRNNVLVNVVDNKELSTFIVPSVVRRGDLSIAISTNGKSPLLSKMIKEKLKNEINDGYINLVKKLYEERKILKESNLSTEEKIEIYKKIINNSGLLK